MGGRCATPRRGGQLVLLSDHSPPPAACARAGLIFAGVILSFAGCVALYGVPNHNKCCLLAVVVITAVSTLAMFADGGVITVGITPVFPDDVVVGCVQARGMRMSWGAPRGS